MIFKIAWRNIWRNKRRTFITIASIFFAVLFSVTISSFTRGVYDHMISSTVTSYVGFVQLSQKEYPDNQTLDNSLELTEELKSTILNSNNNVKDIVPRIESFALINHNKVTKSAMVIGIEPEKEDKLTRLRSRITKGDYLTTGDAAVLLGEGLAEKLNLTIGDTIVLIGQGYHGANAAGKYPVKGIVHFGIPDLNNRAVYMPLADAQWFYAANNRITTAVLDLESQNQTKEVASSLAQALDTTNTYSIKTWKQMIPELLDMKEMEEGGSFIMILILYFIVSFGIFGTILMMTKERQYEFGVLLSIGMSRKRLAWTTWVETVLLSLMAVLLGILISYGLMYYLMINPVEVSGDMAEAYAQFGIEAVLPASVDWDLFYVQAFIVLIITSLLALYPCNKIWKMKPIDSMRG